MASIKGIPYIRGCARGRVHRGPAGMESGCLCLLTQDELTTLCTAPDRQASFAALSTLVGGLIIIDGACFSHTMIRLLALGIPTVIISHQQASLLEMGAELVVDGASGIISDEPGAGGLAPPPVALPAPSVPLFTRDRQVIELRASIGDRAGAERALSHGASGIGLVRTENLILTSCRPPAVDDFETAFRGILDAASPLAVTFRLADLTTEKRPAWFAPPAGSAGPLGQRGSRLYLSNAMGRFFRAQVEALNRLAAQYDISIVLPNVATLDEFRRLRSQIRELKSERFDVGLMAETPVSVLSIGEWVQEADMTAIGCNDLMQCLFGADRGVAEVSDLLDPYAPSLYRFLRLVATAAGARVAEVQLCGLLAQVPGAMTLLTGLGFRVYSVEPRLIPRLAEAVCRIDTSEAQALVRKACAAPDRGRLCALLGLAPDSDWSF